MESRVSVPVLAINDPLRLDSLDGPEGDMPEQRRVLDGAPTDTVLAALRRAGVEASASEAWSGLLSGEIDAPVWFAPESFDPGALVIGPCLVREDATLADVREFFGSEVESDAFGIRVYPTEGIGAGDGPEWVEIARDRIDELSEMTPAARARFHMRYFGLLRGLSSVPVVLATLLASGMRDDAAQWRTSREATPSLLALVRRRSRWDTAALAQVLGIDHRSAAALLHRADFALSPTTYRTWQRR